jgi:GTPase SAR1 family protein
MATHLSLKILVIGDENVGKTTIVNYFTLVPIKNTSTVGIDFQSRIVALSADEKRLDLGGNKSDKADHESETLLLSTMKVDIDVKHTLTKPALYDYVKCYFWDTSGAPHFQSLANTYYRDIAAVVVVFLL